LYGAGYLVAELCQIWSRQCRMGPHTPQSLATARGISAVTAVHAVHCTTQSGPEIQVPDDFHRDFPSDQITRALSRRACGRRCLVERPTATTWPPVRSLGAVGPTSTPPVAIAAVPRHVLCGAPIELPPLLWTHAWCRRGQPPKVGVDSDAGETESISAGGPRRRGERASPGGWRACFWMLREYPI